MINEQSADEEDKSPEEKWQEFADAAFEAAGLPEVSEDQLEVGTYTNAQISEMLHGNGEKLLALLMQVSDIGDDVAAKRSVLSFAVDM